MNDDIFYEIVAKELRENKLVDALWLKAMVETSGDAERAKIVYVKYRVQQLHQQEEQRKIEAENEAKRFLARRREQEIQEHLAKYGPGHACCPKCSFTGYMMRVTFADDLFAAFKSRRAKCPHCSFIFPLPPIITPMIRP